MHEKMYKYCKILFFLTGGFTTPIAKDESSTKILSRKRRVIYGDDATVSQWVGFASILAPGGANGEYPPWHFCGGTILDETHILTGANCDIRVGSDSVQIGSDSAYKDWRVGTERGPQWLSITDQVEHPQYIKGHPPLMDFRVLTVDPPIKFGNRAQPIQLATTEEVLGVINSENPNCYMLGNGKQLLTKEYTGGEERGDRSKLSKRTQRGRQEPTKMGTDFFFDYFKDKFPNNVDELRDGLYMTASLTEDSPPNLVTGCTGDGGGPHLCEIDGVFKQMGLMSFSTGWCSGITGWWNVGLARDWIMQNSDYDPNREDPYWLDRNAGF